MPSVPADYAWPNIDVAVNLRDSTQLNSNTVDQSSSGGPPLGDCGVRITLHLVWNNFNGWVGEAYLYQGYDNFNNPVSPFPAIPDLGVFAMGAVVGWYNDQYVACGLVVVQYHAWGLKAIKSSNIFYPSHNYDVTDYVLGYSNAGHLPPPPSNRIFTPGTDPQEPLFRGSPYPGTSPPSITFPGSQLLLPQSYAGGLNPGLELDGALSYFAPCMFVSADMLASGGGTFANAQTVGWARMCSDPFNVGDGSIWPFSVSPPGPGDYYPVTFASVPHFPGLYVASLEIVPSGQTSLLATA